MAVSGFVSSPAAGRGNRAQQYFFCNGRCIRSAALQTALEQAYRNTLLTGRFPACVLYLTLSPAAVDVNVHPAKTEVKFTQEKRVFDAVYYAALSALQREGRAPAEPAKPAPEPRAHTEPKPDSYRTMTSAAFRGGTARPAAPAPRPAPPTAYAPGAHATATLRSPTAARAPATGFSAPPVPAAVPVRPVPAQTARPEPSALPEAPHASPLAAAAPAPARLIGEMMDTYILAEKGDALVLIDKHAAHERINFDRLRRQDCAIMSQTLLAPIPFTPAPADAEPLRSALEELSALGFELDSVGESAYVIRAVPAQLDPGDAGSALEEICGRLRRGQHADAHSVRDEMLKTVACKAAIKAGWKTEPQELLRLVDAVCSGEVLYCPHGRPVAVTLTRKELDKLFKRIV